MVVLYPKREQAAVHIIPSTELTVDQDSYFKIFSDKDLEDGLAALRKLDAELIRGDLVRFECIENIFNRGLVIFDGKKLVPLHYVVDDSGTIPPSFPVIEEFPIHYWHPYKDSDPRLIQCNCVVWFNPQPYMQDIKDNMVISYDENDERFGQTTFFVGGKQYRIIFDSLMDQLDHEPYQELAVGINTNDPFSNFYSDKDTNRVAFNADPSTDAYSDEDTLYVY